MINYTSCSKPQTGEIVSGAAYWGGALAWVEEDVIEQKEEVPGSIWVVVDEGRGLWEAQKIGQGAELGGEYFAGNMGGGGGGQDGKRLRSRMGRDMEGRMHMRREKGIG